MYRSPLGIQVISSVHIIYGKPEYHISMTDGGHRIASSIVPTILKQFGAEGFEEDNHAPHKQMRSFWEKIVEPQRPCECADEKPEIHGDYIWREDKGQH